MILPAASGAGAKANYSQSSTTIQYIVGVEGLLLVLTTDARALSGKDARALLGKGRQLLLKIGSAKRATWYDWWGTMGTSSSSISSTK